MEISTLKIITQIECKFITKIPIPNRNLKNFLISNNVERIVSGKIIQSSKTGEGKITVGYESFPLNYNASLGEFFSR